MRPVFSVVMPTYGVEKYIEKAIRSVQAQTFGNWELLVIDDCTCDQSAEIACEIAKTDSRIRIVHHEINQGLSAARNTGIQEAVGEYIWFMDPDDWVEPELMQAVAASLEKNRAEMVLFGLQEEYYAPDGHLQYSHPISPTEQYFTTQETLRKEFIRLEQQTLYGYAWNKFYNLDYLKSQNLWYTDVKLIEDIKFNVEYCMNIQRMNLLAITPYHYAKRVEMNLTNKFVENYYKLHEWRIAMILNQYRSWKLDNENVRAILGGLYGRYILSALQRNCSKEANMSYRMRKKWCRNLFERPLFRELIPGAKAKDSFSLKIALRCLKWKQVGLCLVLGRGIYLVREKMPVLYSKVKAER